MQSHGWPFCLPGQSFSLPYLLRFPPYLLSLTGDQPQPDEQDALDRRAGKDYAQGNLYDHVGFTSHPGP
jgi:hypothetical protein